MPQELFKRHGLAVIPPEPGDLSQHFSNLEGTTTHRGETWYPHTKDYIFERIININCSYMVFIWLWKDTVSFWVLLNCGFRCWKVASSDECFHMPLNKLWVFHPLIWVNIPLLISNSICNTAIGITSLQWLCSASTAIQEFGESL